MPTREKTSIIHKNSIEGNTFFFSDFNFLIERNKIQYLANTSRRIIIIIF